jgi:hypothetical protein
MAAQVAAARMAGTAARAEATEAGEASFESVPDTFTAIFYCKCVIIALIFCALSSEVLSLPGGALPSSASVAKPPLLPESPFLQPESPPALADGCRHVYLDLGSNVGVQFRKLFSPDAFPEALIGPKFLQYFGPGKRKDVCAWGWEPNMHHTVALTTLQEAYRARGRRITIFTETAAGTFDGEGVFVSDNQYQDLEWGGSVVALSPGDEAPPDRAVHIMDVAKWIDSNIVRRRLPPDINASNGEPPLAPVVIAKIDIEGSDEGVLAELFRRGVLCHIAYIYVEDQHVRQAVSEFLNLATSRARACPGRTFDDPVIHVLDDETSYLEEWREPPLHGRRLRAPP